MGISPEKALSEEVIFELRISRSKLGNNHVFGKNMMNDSIFLIFLTKHY